MNKEPRKATDLLLDLESKIDTILLLIKNQDLNIKLISNKLNDVVNELNSLKQNDPLHNTSNKSITVESVDQFTSSDNKEIIINSDFNIQTDNNPIGFRRTSRPETFSGDDSYLNQNSEIQFPLQIPNSESVKDIHVKHVKDQESDFKNYEEKLQDIQEINNISIIQRIVDKNGKSVFLADVEIFNQSNESVLKTRTNGTGKWMASIPPGIYKVIIRKRESLTKEKMEIVQNLTIDSSQSSQELGTAIIK